MSDLLLDTHGPDPVMQGTTRLVQLVLGPDRQTRGRTGIVLVCACMYLICCAVAVYAVEIGLMRPLGPVVLISATLPAYTVFYVLARSGFTRNWEDSGLMVAQNLYSLVAISFAYVTLEPSGRNMVLVLIAVVIVFGMYTHKPALSMLSGFGTLVLLGASLGVLSRIDPDFYPPKLELLRFGVMLGALPVLVFTAYHISSWRNRLATQRRELLTALDQVQKLATRDALTGLYNRRHMQELINNKVQRFHRYNEHFTVVLIDLDHFKRINDDHGHQVGDQALMTFASAVTAVLRDTDTLARWGGEEFLCLMSNTSPEKAAIALDRIRDALHSMPISGNAPQLRLKFSAGLAVYDGNESAERTIERADHALYEAKSSGRNRNMISTVPMPSV